MARGSSPQATDAVHPSVVYVIILDVKFLLNLIVVIGLSSLQTGNILLSFTPFPKKLSFYFVEIQGPFLILLDPKYRLLGLLYSHGMLKLWNDMKFVALLGLSSYRGVTAAWMARGSSPQATDAVCHPSIFYAITLDIRHFN
ncbi:hypothetical protein KFK09_023229 [Dendrobium nobile]|uniref:Uncharacterized protein n=1 Tax=Dendrobium nobile TaxID=94219 RepID=A0A8T3AKX6_DENNO|nr:hypothetical protein KFK09_023229 [Dendrobium nobile]